MEKAVDFDKRHYTSDVFSQLNHFRKNRQYCDFTIKCGNIEIPVHKCLIAASSEYFNAMLSHDTKENREGVVNIKQADPTCVEKCVEFMYTREAVVPDYKQEELIRLADMFRLKKLFDGIIDMLKNELDEESFFSSREIANIYPCQDLLTACNDFAICNFHIIMKKDNFKELDAEYITFLLSSNDLKVLDDVKCKALMNWVNYNENKVCNLFSLLKHVEITNVSLSYRNFLLDNEPAVFNSSECLEYVMNSISTSIEAEVRGVDYSGDCSPGIIFANTVSRQLERFDIEKQSWTEMHALKDNTAKHQHSVVLVDRYLYLIDWDQSMFRIKINEPDATWEELAPPIAGCNGPVAVANKTLYVGNYLQLSRTLAKYDIERDRWCKLPNRKQNMNGSCLAYANDKLFVIGGRDESNGFPCEVECYDPCSSTWSLHEEKISIGRVFASACTRKNRIYVFGGLNNNDASAACFETVDILLAGEGYCSFLMLGNLCRNYFLSHNLCGKIYLVAGDVMSDLSGCDQTIGVFDPEENSITDEISLGDHDHVLSQKDAFSSAVVIM